MLASPLLRFLKGFDMKTQGTLTTKQLDAILAQFPANASIYRGDTIRTVKAPDGSKVLSAAKMGSKWHVMAAPGLVSAA